MKFSFEKIDIIKYLFIALVAYLSKCFVEILNKPSEDNISQQVESETVPEIATPLVDIGNTQGHDYVDLGLSVKWATCNVGAENPWDYGDHFAWGETKTKSKYDYNSIYHSSLRLLTSKGVVDKDENLTENYDAATANWGFGWRMPKFREFHELVDECKWIWGKYNGINGYKVIGKNGNWIFLPASGHVSQSFNYLGEAGNYWCSTYDYDLHFESDKKYISHGKLFIGLSVRPVTEEIMNVTLTSVHE